MTITTAPPPSLLFSVPPVRLALPNPTPHNPPFPVFFSLITTAILIPPLTPMFPAPCPESLSPFIFYPGALPLLFSLPLHLLQHQFPSISTEVTPILPAPLCPPLGPSVRIPSPSLDSHDNIQSLSLPVPSINFTRNTIATFHLHLLPILKPLPALLRLTSFQPHSVPFILHQRHLHSIAPSALSHTRQLS